MAPWCAAVDCTNNISNSSVSFFKLPRDKETADIWKVKIKRKNLPKVIYLCEEHFEDSCFDKSVDMKNRLMDR